MKAVVLTTSYPREPGDIAGLFVADAVSRLRERGVDVEVVSPASFRHFGLAYGSGIVGNLRRRPWLALFLPFFVASFALAARRAARGADVVHAHWLPSAAVGLLTRRPVVAQVWGTDVALARRLPAAARTVLRRARIVVAPSNA
ncbi:MAG TPA: glycosyltransferase, partial [Gaiellaceae bacterium]|nr:glycosyltransferase [Gaiellaceae bacterium]